MGEFWLDVYQGVGEVRRVRIGDAPLRIGRTQACDVVVGGAGVSRLHCEIRRSGAELRLLNHSSTKAGTLVNGVRVTGERPLAPGDEVGVGQAVLVVGTGSGGLDQESVAADDARAPARGGGLPSRAAGAAPPAPSDAKGSDGASSPPPRPGSAREAARALAARKRLERRLGRTAGWVSAVLVSCGSTYAVLKLVGASGRPVASAGAQSSRPRVAVEPPAPAADGRPATAQARSGEPGDADEAWARLRLLSPDALPEGLAAFAESYPDDPRGDDALFFAEQLRARARNAGDRRLGAALDALVAEARRLARQGDRAGAHAVCALVEALRPGSSQQAAARELRLRLRREAEAAVRELEGRARALSVRLGPVQAILLVLEEQSKLRGLGQDERIDALVDALERQVAERAATRGEPAAPLSPEATTVAQRGIAAALRFDFATAWKELDALLLLSLDDEARLRAHWLRRQVRGLERLLAAGLAAAQGPAEDRPELTLAGSLRARLVRFDGEEVVLSPVVAKGSGVVRLRRGRLTPAQAQELFAKLGADDWPLAQAKAFHALRTGLEERAMRILIPFARRRRLRSEVFSFYALAAEVPLPRGGFVVFEGRLVDPAEKARVLAERREAREAARALARAAREAKGRKALERLLASAVALMDRGHYAAGREALARLVARHADVPDVGEAARARLEGPMLRRRDVRVVLGRGRNGPSANRLDIYFFGDGYVLDDRKQVLFDRAADGAVRACQAQDFFREYDSYINYWAVNLASAEEGLSKDGERKDTALGTEVNGGVYTVGPGRERMLRLLERWWPGEHDRLAVSVGNDYASVATGGGGAVAVAKTMVSVTPHELGHAFGGLADEYEQEPGPNPGPPRPHRGPPRVVGPNVVAAEDEAAARAAAPWKAWFDARGPGNWTGKPIGVFEGAHRQRKGYWRPQRACVMRDAGAPFCAVCMEVMVRALYRRVHPIDRAWPEGAELEAERGVLTFRVLVLKPATHALFVHWRRETLERFPDGPTADEDPLENGEGEGTRARRAAPLPIPQDERVVDVSGKLQVIEGNYVHYIKVRPGELAPGRYRISAEVWDPTPWVRDSKRVLRQERAWTLTVPRR